MRKSIFYLANLLLLLIFSQIFAQNHLSPPFYEVTIPPQGNITVSYQFNPLTQTLYCWDSWNANSLAIWTYKDNLQTSSMPVRLKNNSVFKGRWANPEGDLYIQNVDTNQKMMLVTCNYLAG